MYTSEVAPYHLVPEEQKQMDAQKVGCPYGLHHYNLGGPLLKQLNLDQL